MTPETLARKLGCRIEFQANSVSIRNLLLGERHRETIIACLESHSCYDWIKTWDEIRYWVKPGKTVLDAQVETVKIWINRASDIERMIFFGSSEHSEHYTNEL